MQHLKKVELITQENQTLSRYLLYLASKHPVSVTFSEIENVLDVSASQVSRALHRKSHRGKQGLDYLDIGFDVDSPKTKLVTLNRKGLQSAELLVEPWLEQY